MELLSEKLAGVAVAATILYIQLYLIIKARLQRFLFQFHYYLLDTIEFASQFKTIDEVGCYYFEAEVDETAWMLIAIAVYNTP